MSVKTLETKECWVCHRQNPKKADRCERCGTIFGGHGLHQTTPLETVALKQAWSGQLVQCDLARHLNKPKEDCGNCYWYIRHCFKDRAVTN